MTAADLRSVRKSLNDQKASGGQTKLADMLQPTRRQCQAYRRPRIAAVSPSMHHSIIDVNNYRRWGSNPHGDYSLKDFKTSGSAVLVALGSRWAWAPSEISSYDKRRL
jgi:hypothetical protein